MPSDARAVLEAERARPVPPDAVVERIRAAAAAAMVGGGGVGGAGGAAPRSGEEAPGTAPGADATAAPTFAAWLRLGLPSLVLGVALGAAIAFVAVGGTGADGPPARRASEPRPAGAEVRPSAGRVREPAAVEAAPVSAGGGASPAAPPPRASPQAPGPSPLAAERVLIERAQSAIARHEWTEAGRALDAHARRFPRGALAREREILRARLVTEDAGSLQ